MSRRLCPLLLIVPLLLAADAKPEWKEFTDKETGFSISFPGEPKRMPDQTVKTALGDAPLKIFLVELGRDTVYMVMVSDYPQGAIRPGSEDKALDNARDGILGKLKGKPLVDEKIKLGNHPGRAIQVDAPAVGIYRTNIYLVKDRMYQVVILAPRETVTSKETDKYFESFKLVK